MGGTASDCLRRAGRRNVDHVDNRSEIRDFLTTRRAKVSPEQAGLARGVGVRRVPGLRREEVATLAGVSIEWYTRLEKGNIVGVSEEVLEAVARTLELDEAERAHLFDLARAARPVRTARRPTPTPTVRANVQLVLDAMSTAPAFVRNGRLDILATNPLGRALYSPVWARPTRPVNLARFTFLGPDAIDFYPDWDEAADTTVALLRTEAGRDPHNREFSDLVGELATRSRQFAARWAAHDVRLHRSGVKHFHHPLVGDLDLGFEAMNLSAETGLTLTVYTAEPGSSSQDGLALLASWSATSSEPTEPATGDVSNNRVV